MVGLKQSILLKSPFSGTEQEKKTAGSWQSLHLPRVSKVFLFSPGWSSHQESYNRLVMTGQTGRHRGNHTINSALLARSFVWQLQLYFLHISFFKIIKRKYFIQSKCEFIKFLFVLLYKIKILPLYTVYLPHHLPHMLSLLHFETSELQNS